MTNYSLNLQSAPEWLAFPDAGLPGEVIGTKAFNLSLLRRLGFNVPDCLFITTLHSKYAQFESADSYLASIDDFSRHLKEYLPSPHGWAVRSSATIEDMPGESHAGRFETKFISAESELADAVRSVWDSADSAGIGPDSMGVVVQRLIDADFAGVAFSHDPTRKHRTTVIEGVPGNAARFVDGELEPFRVRPSDADARIPDGLAASSIAAIDDGVGRLAKELGGPIDTEWAVSDGDLYWLQVRPLTGTSAREFVIPESERSELKGLWVRINHSFAPQATLVSSMNPGGFFDGPGWKSRLVNGFHYIQQESAPPETVPVEDFDRVLDEWDEWEQRFDSLHGERRRADLATLEPAELWRETLARIDLGREYFTKYSDPRFLEIRDRTEKRVSNFVEAAGGDSAETTAVLAELLGQLGSLTEEKQSRLRGLAALHDADPARDLRDTPEWQQFMQAFGYEAATTHLFYLPSLQESPDLVMEMIASTSVEASAEGDRKGWQSAAESIAEKLPDTDRREFEEQLQRWRRCMLRTEDDDYALAKCTMLVRDAYLESGRRLVKDGLIEERDDVFHMTGAQLQEALTGTRGDDLLPSIRRRRKEFEQRNLLNPPAMIVNGRAMTPKARKSGSSLSGTPASPGVAGGNVLVLDDPFSSMGRKLPAGSVIVAPIITPSLAYSLVGCSAIVTEIGGLASHGAIVAREMGIPAVVGVTGARAVLRTGMSVAVNGSTGEIEMTGSAR